MMTTGATRLPAGGGPKSANAAAWSALAVLCPLLLACSGNNGWQPPTVVLDTPSGPTPIYSPTPTPTPTMPGGLVGPPPGLETSATPVPASPGSRGGSYSGVAEPLQTGGGLCLQTRPVSGFHVRGNTVRYGGFRGTIDANNGLQMVYGRDWIIGQFDGATFHGQLDLNGRFGAPGCTYELSLQRTGA